MSPEMKLLHYLTATITAVAVILALCDLWAAAGALGLAAAVVHTVGFFTLPHTKETKKCLNN